MESFNKRCFFLIKGSIILLRARKKIESFLKTKMLCPIFRMVFGQNYVPSAVCYMAVRSGANCF